MSSLTVSLNELKKAGACRERYAHLVEKLGGVSFDHDARINLLTVMEHNGLKDTLWALRRIPTKRGKIICILFAADCAERVLPLFEQRFPNDDRPRVTDKACSRAIRRRSGVTVSRNVGKFI